MSFYTSSPNDLAVASAVQTWLMTVLSFDINHVIYADPNRVAQQTGDYAVISFIASKPWGTPWITYNDTGVQATEAEVTNMSVEVTYQIDIYGPNAADNMMIIFVLLRSDATSEWLASYGLANGITLDTFYTDEPKRSVITNEEDQYEDHWITRVRLDTVQQVSSPVNFMSVLSNPAVTLHDIQ
jgi:hypothetical protein